MTNTSTTTALIGDGVPTSSIRAALTGFGPSATLARLLGRQDPTPAHAVHARVTSTQIDATDLITDIRGEFISGQGGRHRLVAA